MHPALETPQAPRPDLAGVPAPTGAPPRRHAADRLAGWSRAELAAHAAAIDARLAEPTLPLGERARWMVERALVRERLRDLSRRR